MTQEERIASITEEFDRYCDKHPEVRNQKHDNYFRHSGLDRAANPTYEELLALRILEGVCIPVIIPYDIKARHIVWRYWINWMINGHGIDLESLTPHSFFNYYFDAR